MLIGDAAGLAFPQSGEGIRPAVESGLLAAKVITSTNSNYGTEAMQAYSDLLKKQFGDGSGSPPAAAFLPQWLRNTLARFLFKKQWFCRRVVVESWFLR
jgi:2-polyprenyl-6-methoxyphenol hydroxylase-like FAD-dependent oxidoreductase